MSIHINYDGEVGICDFNETPDDFKGLNINEQSFLKIWNSKKYIELRKRHVSKEYIKFCSDFCIGKRFVDFEEILYLPKKQEIVSGEKILSIL